MAGRVIVLNGTSSSGKTSLGRALQETLAGDWHLLGTDTLMATCPPHWYVNGTIDFVDGVVVTGLPFRAVYDRWRRGVAALVDAGTDVILDEVLLAGSEDQARWQAALAEIRTCWVKVDCQTDVAVQRERERGDRTIGLVADQAGRVHVGVVYDLEVDTATATPDELAATLAPSIASCWSG